MFIIYKEPSPKLSGTITFDTIKEVFNVNVSSSAATAITNKIHEILYSQNTSAENLSPSSAYSPADEILKYKNLLDIGAITEEEYNQKKQELLQQWFRIYFHLYV